MRVTPRRAIVLASLFVVSLASVATAQRYGFLREGPGNEVRFPPRGCVRRIVAAPANGASVTIEFASILGLCDSLLGAGTSGFAGA